MQIKNSVLKAAIAGAVMLATAGAAFAAPGVATGNVNVRSGPGTGYAVVDVLRRGERVDVEYCRGNWCFVEKRGPDGWVSANYLRTGRGHSGGGYSAGPGFSFEFNFGNAPPPRPQHPRPPRPGHGGWDNDWNGGWNGHNGPRRPRDWN